MIFTEVELDVEKIRCSGSIVLDVSLANIGKDEEDVLLTVMNDKLDIDISEEFELDDDPFDDDSRYDKKFTLVVNDADKGVYPIVVEAEYGNEDVRETISLEVLGCEEEVIIEEDIDEKVEKKDIEEEIKEIIISREEVQIVANETSFLDEYGTILVVGVILAIIALTFIVAATVALKS